MAPSPARFGISRRVPEGRLHALLLFVLAMLLLDAVSAVSAQGVDATPFSQQLQALPSASYADKETLIAEIEASGHPQSPVVLQALLDGRLYSRESDHRVLIVEDTQDGYRAVDALDESDVGVVEKGDIKKIGVNNRLRGQLRAALARLSLASPDARVRADAAAQMIGQRDAETEALLRARLVVESDADVRELIETALAVIDLGSEDAATRLEAVRALDGSLQPEVLNRLNALLATSGDGEYAEPDAAVRAAATQAVKNIQFKRDLYAKGETVFFGLSLGSVLLLAAIGLAITFGVMGVINMAHGELMMLGAYTTYVVQLLMPNHIGLSLFVAVPAAFLVAGLVGIAIERGVIRFLYGRPLETLLATFGISLILQQLVRSVFSPLNRTVITPEWMSGSWQINAAFSLTYNRLYIVVFALLVFAALLLILNKTPLGLQVRAVSQNRNMAKAMGIRTEWVDAMTFGLGSGIAGVAGVALSQLTNVGPNLGQSYIIDSFMVVVFGGVGNLWGTLVGALTLGVVNKILEPATGAVLAKILVLVFIILFIQRRPRGLFPKRGRGAED